jgi:hypothetical protein
MARRPGKTLGFYLLSAPVLSVLFLTLDLILLRSAKVSIYWTIALAPVAAVLFFVYARLLGRLGLIVSYSLTEVVKPPPPRRRKPKRPVHAYDPNTRVFGPKEEIPDDPPVRAQPSELPPMPMPFNEPVTGYDVDYEGKTPVVEEPKPTIVHYFDDEDNTPITVAPPPDITSSDRQRIAEELANPPQREMELYMRERPAEPANPYGAESVTFLFDPKTIDPWLRLTLGLVVMALLLRALDLLRPE